MSDAHSILFPDLPFRMKGRVDTARRDVKLQQFVGSATRLKDGGRKSALGAAFGERAEEVRIHAGAIKQHTLDHLDHYLALFVKNATAAGAKVHAASTGKAAVDLALAIATAANDGNGCTLCVKSKSMVTEEIGLLPALQAAGVETLETDLGEFILQLDGDAPSHIVTPMIHKDRTAVARAFVRELGAPYTEDPTELSQIARRHMRAKYRAADLGVSGANFLIADTGTLVLCTNEGNADLAVTCPPLHIAIVGIEKLIPSMADLPVFIKLLARSATAQPITVYTSLVTGPRRGGEPHGPRDVHIILLDNGRSSLLAGEARELLRCIRCGACLNACPVYRQAGGGHAYGAVYSGPIGAVLTPHLLGLENYADLPRASSLCGACHEACPVHIDIPKHLISHRKHAAEMGLEKRGDRAFMRMFTWALAGPKRYRAASRVLGIVMRGMADATDTRGAAWLTAGPGPIGEWTRARDFMAPPRQSFREWWAENAADRGRNDAGPSPVVPPRLPHDHTHRHAAFTRQSAAGLGADVASLHARVRSMLAGIDATPRPPAREELCRLVGRGEDAVAMFQAAATTAGMTVTRCGPGGAAAAIESLVKSRGWRRIGVSPGAGVDEACRARIAAGGCVIAEDAADLFDLDAGITDCVGAVAETGSIVVGSGAQRGLAIVPPVHVCIVRAPQVHADLIDLFAGDAVGRSMGSGVVIISGPSKTADIEGVLVRGVHGPGEVVVLLVAG